MYFLLYRSEGIENLESTKEQNPNEEFHLLN